MFGFFKKKSRGDPPTPKQVRYAKRLGIVVKPGMTKDDLSAAIGAVERASPRVAEQRELVKRKLRERKFGPTLIAEESSWNEFADDIEYMLAIYRDGKEVVVDVLRVNEAWVSESGKLVLAVEAPKRVKDPYIGEYLEWDRYFELPREKLLHYEPLGPDFYTHDREGFASANKVYQGTVQRGLKLARKLLGADPSEA